MGGHVRSGSGRPHRTRPTTGPSRFAWATTSTHKIIKCITYLVLIRAPHRLHDFLSLLLGNATVLGDNGRQDRIDLARHVRRVAADVEVGFLLEELVDELGILLEAVLDVDLFGAVTREGGNDLEVVAEGFLVLLWCVSGGSKGCGV